ncbi:hypothetical protein [Rhizobium leguminosarum]|uniref:hypothetical protein n=1 Tax=Rhizobium leguminosarum TaxID=384 RepID=UPI001FDF0D8F|nr:hypothetical protein [Rhizobium leguminosarum]
MVIIDAANAVAIIVHDHIIIRKNGDVGLKGLTLIKHRYGLNGGRKTICNIDRLPIKGRHFAAQ